MKILESSQVRCCPRFGSSGPALDAPAQLPAAQPKNAQNTRQKSARSATLPCHVRCGWHVRPGGEWAAMVRFCVRVIGLSAC